MAAEMLCGPLFKMVAAATCATELSTSNMTSENEKLKFNFSKFSMIQI